MKNPVKTILCSVTVSAFGGACTTPGKDLSKHQEFVAQPLSGRVGGEDWAFKYGYIDPTAKTLEEDDFMFVLLSYKPRHRCPRSESIPQDKKVVMISAPVKLKTQFLLKRGTSRVAIFSYTKGNAGNVNEAVKFGKIQMQSMSKGKNAQMKGRMIGNVNAENWVNGNFAVTICDPKEMEEEAD